MTEFSPRTKAAALIVAGGIAASGCAGETNSPHTIDNPTAAAQEISHLYSHCEVTTLKDTDKRRPDGRPIVRLALNLTMNTSAKPFYQEWVHDNGSSRGDVDWANRAIVTELAPTGTDYHNFGPNGQMPTNLQNEDGTHLEGELYPNKAHPKGTVVDIWKDTSVTVSDPKVEHGNPRSILTAVYCGQMTLKAVEGKRGKIAWEKTPSTQPLHKLQYEGKTVPGTFSLSPARALVYNGK